MVHIRTDIQTYVAEPPRIIDPVLHARLKNPHAPWSLSPEYLLRKQPTGTVVPRAGQIHGGHVVSASVYTPRLELVSQAKIIKVNVIAMTLDGYPIEGLSFSSAGVIVGKGIAPSGVVSGEVKNTNALGRSTFSIYEGIPIRGGTGTTGWEITPKGRKWRNDLVPTSVTALPNAPITITFKPEAGTAQVTPGLH